MRQRDLELLTARLEVMSRHWAKMAARPDRIAEASLATQFAEWCEQGAELVIATLREARSPGVRGPGGRPPKKQADADDQNEGAAAAETSPET